MKKHIAILTVLFSLILVSCKSEKVEKEDTKQTTEIISQSNTVPNETDDVAEITTNLTTEVKFITLSDEMDSYGNKLTISCDSNKTTVTLKYYLDNKENIADNIKGIASLLLLVNEYTEYSAAGVVVSTQSGEDIMLAMLQNDGGGFKGTTGLIWHNGEYEEAYNSFVKNLGTEN